MARLVRHTATGPIRIDPENLPKDKPLFICACGLSQTLPLCDGSHKGCRAEMEGTLYVYDVDRKTIRETRLDAASALPSVPAAPPGSQADFNSLPAGQ